jgi:transposase-like protein
MGQVLHGGATTTEAIRRAIQNGKESLRALSRRYGINQKTVAKWKKRTSVADLPTGPKDPRSRLPKRSYVKTALFRADSPNMERLHLSGSANWDGFIPHLAEYRYST